MATYCYHHWLCILITGALFHVLLCTICYSMYISTYTDTVCTLPFCIYFVYLLWYVCSFYLCNVASLQQRLLSSRFIVCWFCHRNGFLSIIHACYTVCILVTFFTDPSVTVGVQYALQAGDLLETGFSFCSIPEFPVQWAAWRPLYLLYMLRASLHLCSSWTRIPEAAMLYCSRHSGGCV